MRVSVGDDPVCQEQTSEVFMLHLECSAEDSLGTRCSISRVINWPGNRLNEIFFLYAD